MPGPRGAALSAAELASLSTCRWLWCPHRAGLTTNEPSMPTNPAVGGWSSNAERPPPQLPVPRLSSRDPRLQGRGRAPSPAAPTADCNQWPVFSWPPLAWQQQPAAAHGAGTPVAAVAPPPPELVPTPDNRPAAGTAPAAPSVPDPAPSPVGASIAAPPPLGKASAQAAADSGALGASADAGPADNAAARAEPHSASSGLPLSGDHLRSLLRMVQALPGNGKEKVKRLTRCLSGSCLHATCQHAHAP